MPRACRVEPHVLYLTNRCGRSNKRETPGGKHVAFQEEFAALCSCNREVPWRKAVASIRFFVLLPAAPARGYGI